MLVADRPPHEGAFSLDRDRKTIRYVPWGHGEPVGEPVGSTDFTKAVGTKTVGFGKLE